MAAYLCGCATNSRDAAAIKEPEPDCSFRSPSTCWSVGSRFPTEATTPPVEPDQLLSDSAPVFAAVESAQPTLDLHGQEGL
jgi:hypothetical protein